MATSAAVADPDDSSVASEVCHSSEGYFDIMVLGKTGQGKSTTANKLLGLDVDARSGTVSTAVTVYGEPNSQELVFPVATSNDSVSKTQFCKLLSSEVANLKVRVLDVPGLSKKDLEEALSLQSKNGLAFDRVLYFLPIHGPLCKADGCVQEEIKVIHDVFDRSIFDRMIIIATWPPRQSMEGFPFTEEDISDTKRSFELALKKALGKHAPKCPEIRYISLNMTPQEVLELMKTTPKQNLIPLSSQGTGWGSSSESQGSQHLPEPLPTKSYHCCCCSIL